jgi:hypothetical protein
VTLSRIVAALLSIAKNGVPALGVLLRDWAAPSAMLLYLGENIVLALLGALTVLLVAPQSEVIAGKLKARRESLQTFFLIAAPFTFGAAVITLAVIVIRTEYAIDAREIATGFGLMLLFQVIAFFAGLRQMRGMTLAESENMLVSILGRIFLLAFAVWIGLILAFFVSSAFVIPFMILKTIVDLASLRSDAAKRRLVQ